MNPKINIESFIPYIKTILNFYANKENYSNGNIEKDECGFLAREAINQINVIESEILQNNEEYVKLRDNTINSTVHELTNFLKNINIDERI